MNYLKEFAGRQEVRRIISESIRYNSVQGVVVEVDPLWLHLWKLNEKYGSNNTSTFDWRLYPFSHLIRPLKREDLYWRPNVPDNYFEKYRNSELPLRIVICLYPSDRSSNVRTDIPRFDTKINIVYETRGVSKFASKNKFRPLEGGISIGQGNSSYGTLGGILTDGSKKYGLSCGHVLNKLNANVDQPSFYDDSSNGNNIGNVVLLSIPKISTSICNPYNNSQNINTLDCALIELNKKVSHSVLNIGQIKNFVPISNLSQGDSVEYNGRSSSHKVLEIGGLAVVYKIEDENNDVYCFKDLIEIKDPGFWGSFISSPVKGGDSGSWVCMASGSNFDWCGVVVGGDRQVGYMISSEYVMDWLTNNNYSLTLN